jgi:NAD+ kinase
MTRIVLLVAHTGRPEAVDSTRRAVALLGRAGIQVRMTAQEAELVGVAGSDGTAGEPDVQTIGEADTDACAEGCELVVVIGGDGTLLRGAEFARTWDVPLLGVNLGHFGFLAEAEQADLDETVARIAARDYRVDERMTLAVTVRDGSGAMVADGWALNEASIEKAAHNRMLEMVVTIDDQPLSRWSCDGVVAATPTGSTAYAFSAGGPIVWPGVEALLVVPLSAHALFARPLVVAPSTPVGFQMLNDSADAAVLWCDGRRPVELPPRATVTVRRSDRVVRFARVSPDSFTRRLVDKFELPVAGWRGRREALVAAARSGAPEPPEPPG